MAQIFRCYAISVIGIRGYTWFFLVCLGDLDVSSIYEEGLEGFEETDQIYGSCFSDDVLRSGVGDGG